VFKVVENKECFTRGLQLLNRISMQVIKYTQLFTRPSHLLTEVQDSCSFYQNIRRHINFKLGFELLNNWWRP